MEPVLFVVFLFRFSDESGTTALATDLMKKYQQAVTAYSHYPLTQPMLSVKKSSQVCPFVSLPQELLDHPWP